MYLIALCDDEAGELDKTERMLRSYQRKHHRLELVIERFESASELLYMVKEEKYIPDLVLLDIYMPEKLGIEVARELNSIGSGGKIIFLTNSREHALDAFGVYAVQYLVKPVSKDTLFSVLDRFLKEIDEERKRYILLRIEGRIQRVTVNDIAYCEAHGKAQCMYLVQGTQLLLRMTMAEIYQMLSGYQEFVRVGISYIVNLEYMDSLNAQEICMSTGKKIYLPRGAYKTLKEQYFGYYCEKG